MSRIATTDRNGSLKGILVPLLLVCASFGYAFTDISGTYETVTYVFEGELKDPLPEGGYDLGVRIKITQYVYQIVLISELGRRSGSICSAILTGSIFLARHNLCPGEVSVTEPLDFIHANY